MTVDAARRTRRRGPKAGADPEPMVAPLASLAIGEIDQTVFDCPSCGRPLALGARRCPGCRVRLVNGVTFGKASGFIAAGLVVGLLAGAGGGLLFGSRQTAVAAPAAATAAATGGMAPGASNDVAVPRASTTVGPTSTPAATPANAIPPVTRSALVQVVAMNGRLTTAAADLRAILAASAFDASGVAQILRTVSADSVFGEQLAQRVAAWPPTSALGSQLAGFYGAIHDIAANGLVASVQNKAAYRAAATAMLKLVDGLPAIDAVVQAAVASAGVMPPVGSGAATAP